MILSPVLCSLLALSQTVESPNNVSGDYSVIREVPKALYAQVDLASNSGRSLRRAYSPKASYKSLVQKAFTIVRPSSVNPEFIHLKCLAICLFISPVCNSVNVR